MLLSDPGPKTQRSEAGSGLLSFQNDDPGAERIYRHTQQVGRNPSRCEDPESVPLRVVDVREPHAACDRSACVDKGLFTLQLLTHKRQSCVKMAQTVRKDAVPCQRHPSYST